ncbi:MAG: hypothetical protein Kow002_00140 [Anaerolineales bacterium]
MYLFSELNIFPLLILFILWGIGGWLMLARHFDVDSTERGLIGFGLGLVVSNMLANFTARWVPVAAASWLAAILTVALGLWLAWPLEKELLTGFKFRWKRWLWFALAVWIFTLIGRGLAIFDDYQNLPAVSIMATGDIPPHFPLRPDTWFGYHYFLILLSAQIMRVGDSTAWTSIDLARGLVFTLTFALTGLLAWRMTKNRVVSFVAMLFAAFASGTRWLLLFVPVGLLKRISDSLTLIGSGAATASNLFDALALPWAIEGDGPIPFPFAFGNGVNGPLTMMHNGFGPTAVLALLLLLLLGERRKNWLAGIPLVIVLAAMALANEVNWFILYLGFVLAVLVWVMLNRKLPVKQILPWIFISGLAGLLALVQGGMATEIVRGKLFPSPAEADTYFEVGFKLVSPTVISPHLGKISLLDPMQLLAALFEIGPMVVFFPLVIVWGMGALKKERWLESAVAAAAFISGLSVFVEYYGNAGITATTRLLSLLFLSIRLLGIPLVWLWLEKRKQNWVRFGAWGVGIVSVFGGLVMFGIQMIAVPRPVHSYFLTDIDARFEATYWDSLPAESWVLDPDPHRAATVFGRPAKALKNWGVHLPEWDALIESGDPYAAHAAGYDFMYFDKEYWKEHRDTLEDACVRLTDKIDGEKLEHGAFVPDFRMLVDIRGCAK